MKPSLLQRLLTRPVWWCEKRLAPRSRPRWRRLPPVATDPRHPVRVAVLGTARTADESVWAAWSLARFAPVSFTLFLDGAIPAGFAGAASRVLPGVAVQEVRPWLADRELPPALRRLLGFHPMAVKLGLGLALQQDSSALYLDNDVLFFRRPVELLDAFASPHEPRYMLDATETGCHDPAIADRAVAAGHPIARRLNGGLLWMPHGSLDPALADWLVADAAPPVASWFTEQSANAVLFARAGATPLPRPEYYIGNDRQFFWENDVDYSRVAARHFTGPVRHVMYRQGYRMLLDSSAP